MDDAEKPIVKVLDAYKAAVFAKDLARFVALYDQDVRVFDVWGEWSYDGVEAWRGMAADWFGSLGAERVAVTVDDVRTVLAPPVAVVHAFVTYEALSPEGRRLRAMQNRLTWALEQRGAAWKIIHEHTSAPADFGTLKIM